ncbi:MarR family winged helix-turn-helix transcriptional regulator [Rhodococcus sp. NPDC058514]|uniref:MarR family winged helix-turn-helix transcriptional regulator n=1 Tax=unclassified Rhodococcus (in: high G+C Gram-positive bacteria) TaxID=192944 RepID=UPI003645F804
MDTAADRIEFETLLLARHLAHPRRGEGHLDGSAYLLLTRISMQGPMSVGELSEAFGLDTSTLSRQTTSMLSSGLVQRIPDPEGGMARKFRITDEGRRRLDGERAGNVSGLETVLEDWTPDDRAAFAELLERFNLDIERRAGRPWPRPVAHSDGRAV